MKTEEILINELSQNKQKIQDLEKEQGLILFQLAQLKSTKLIELGFDHELVTYYQYKVPLNTNEADYMSWSISEEGLAIFNQFGNTEFLNRYETYSFQDIFFENLVDHLKRKSKLKNIKKSNLDLFLNGDLKSFEGLSIEETILFKLIIKFIYSIKYDNFKYDW